jgi:hypothetical protein
VQDGEKYGGSLAVAVLFNELKGIFSEVQTIIAIYNNFLHLTKNYFKKIKSLVLIVNLILDK